MRLSITFIIIISVVELYGTTAATVRREGQGMRGAADSETRSKTMDKGSERIVGGGDVAEGQIPYLLSIRISGTHACGAVLYKRNKAITAAHCVGGFPQLYTLVGGTTDRTVSSCPTCESRVVQEIDRHSDYVNNPQIGYPNDIGVLTFDDIENNDQINLAVLAAPADGTFEGTSCIIAGWGRTQPDGVGDMPIIAQYAEMTVITTASCTVSWGSSRIYPGHICTYQPPDVSACSGDSGSPIVCNGRLAGIHSWSDSMCSPAFPSVNSRISYYRTWIEIQ